MQRFLVALYLGAASAFAPQQLTQNSRLKLQANPIDIYSAARARNLTSQTLAGAIVTGLLRAANRRAAGSPDIKDSNPTRLDAYRALRPIEDRFPLAGAAEDCLQEECSVDTVPRSAVIIVTYFCPIVGDDAARLRREITPQVQMLVGQLKTREQELAKKGRIVDYEREAALAGVRTMIHDLEGPADPNPVVLAVKAAFDLNKATVYVNK